MSHCFISFYIMSYCVAYHIFLCDRRDMINMILYCIILYHISIYYIILYYIILYYDMVPWCIG